MRPAGPCRHAGCRAKATVDKRCDAHQGDQSSKRQVDHWRGSPASRGYDADWRRTRAAILERDCHLCQDCLEQKRLTPATEVHHEVPIAIDPTRRLDPTNLRSLCKPCHSAITARRDSSFARSKR